METKNLVSLKGLYLSDSYNLTYVPSDEYMNGKIGYFFHNNELNQFKVKSVTMKLANNKCRDYEKDIQTTITLILANGEEYMVDNEINSKFKFYNSVEDFAEKKNELSFRYERNGQVGITSDYFYGMINDAVYERYGDYFANIGNNYYGTTPYRCMYFFKAIDGEVERCIPKIVNEIIYLGNGKITFTEDGWKQIDKIMTDHIFLTKEECSQYLLRSVKVNTFNDNKPTKKADYTKEINYLTKVIYQLKSTNGDTQVNLEIVKTINKLMNE